MSPLMTVEPPLGAHLVTPRRGYSHHGIYVGGGKVVHYAGFGGSIRNGVVVELSIVDFAADREVWVKSTGCTKYCGQEVVLRARSRLGEKRYRLLSNNCEHFCSWCLCGKGRSDQVWQFFVHPGKALHAAVVVLKERVRARLSSQNRQGEPSRVTTG
ncbi:hypothetical protein WQE_13766 [Paraburkholderia hospita]|uniref:LRAT domain-containing protein n=2 Tax=Paraburkholderia hospita TaxID=169430 RepID=A0ABN0FP42_9BURK|nr:hypothetical protein WQE_13766 [Paraburkholderia hospita]OUL68201.1 hypothetical protein CA602_51855 [Paraburkholderia hospita]